MSTDSRSLGTPATAAPAPRPEDRRWGPRGALMFAALTTLSAACGGAPTPDDPTSMPSAESPEPTPIDAAEEGSLVESPPMIAMYGMPAPERLVVPLPEDQPAYGNPAPNGPEAVVPLDALPADPPADASGEATTEGPGEPAAEGSAEGSGAPITVMPVYGMPASFQNP